MIDYSINFDNMLNQYCQRIAVIMTCYNRRDKTVECLTALFKIKIPDGTFIEVYLTDDGSSDGTRDTVKQLFPKVNILIGDGSLYWNGGMRLAFGYALKKNFDYYLWLNDDTILFPSAISLLLEAQLFIKANTGSKGITVGSTYGEDGRVSYGGLVQSNKCRPLKFDLVEPGSQHIFCKTMNGNCVLIAAEVANVLGNLDENFIHSIGDIDYGLRASKSGISVCLIPGYAGICYHDHSLIGSYLDRDVPMWERLKQVIAKKQFPIKSWLTFCRRHAKLFWPIFFMSPYIRALIGKK